ncbi:MAG: creatininase family protein [Actinomycetota bacterium]
MAGFLGSLSGPGAAATLGADTTVVIPVGAIEQHGPHLPLNVDHLIADRAAAAVVERLGPELPLQVAPTLPYSKSNEHAWSPGTLWLSNETMHCVLDDIARCVAFAGVRRLVFLNGHGGNTALLNVACREARLAHGLLTFVIHPFVPPAYAPARPGADASTERGMGIHGGFEETSVMLHLAPELVDMTLAVRNVPEWLADNEHVRFGGSVQFGWLSDDFGPHGHIGDPTAATAEHGRRLFDDAVGFLCDQLREIAAFDFRP